MNIRTYFKGIRARFLQWTVVLTLSICFLASLLFFFTLKWVLTDIGTHFAIQYTLREKSRIQAPLEREIALCEALANSPILGDWLQNNENENQRDSALRELENFKSQFRSRSLFLGVKASGHYYFRGSATENKGDGPAYTMDPNNPRDAWFYNTLKRVDRFHLNVDSDIVDNQARVWINTVIHNGTNRVALVGTGLPLDGFIKQLLNTDNPAVTPILVDPSGAIQAHSNTNLIDHNSLLKKPNERSTIFRLLSSADDRNNLRRALDSLRKDPSKTAALSLTLENQPRLICLAYLPEIDWYLISSVDLSKTLHIAKFSPLALVILFALAVLVMAITYLINRTILSPLQKLTDTAQRVAAGDYSVRAPTLSQDEMGELAKTFNSMLNTIDSHTRQLKTHSEELEHRVRERTAELETEVKERKKAEMAAQMASQAKSEFLANMSHEIRTPMNAILGFSEILSNKLQDPRHREYIRAVHSSGKSLLSLINDVLDLSKVEAGKLRLEYSAIDPRGILNELKTIFSRKIEEKRLAYSTEVDKEFPSAVVLDESRLRQVMLNLLGNAIKFTDQGFIRVVARAQRESAEQGLTLIFEVHDSGIGIKPDQLQSIFAAFEQQAGQSHAKYGGTGLGLAISKRLVELMGGKITVESTVGKGSIFRIILPHVEEAALAHPAEQEAAQLHANIVFEPATILVAEDVLLNRELVRGYLENFQFTILEAANGKAALELAESHNIDLILMDIKMPEMDGIQASTILKSTPATAGIPIVAITASTMKVEEDNIGKICNGFLRKPITRSELISVLAKFLKYSENAPKAECVKPIEEPTSKEDFSQIHDPAGLQKRLEMELAPAWNEIKGTVIVNQVLEFAEKAISIAATHKDAQLARWADNLRNDAMLFNMAGMEETLEQFPGFINRKIK